VGKDHGGAGYVHAGRAGSRRRLAITLGLVAGYMVAEVVGGLVTGSLALLADAGHMLTDAAALALAILAMWIAERPPSPRHSYGFYRTEILAAVANGATLVAIALFIFVEAWHRFRAPPEVQGGLMMAIASGGLVVNLGSLWFLRVDRGESLNVRGAWLHLLTDALGSIGAITGGLLIWAFGWAWADPAVSVLIGLLVVVSSWDLLRETVAVLMESAPAGVDVDAVRNTIAAVPGTTSVHDLHVWSIAGGMVALSVHVGVARDRSGNEVLSTLRDRLRHEFGIDHSTIQVEHDGFEESVTHT
jgi:cobalt-zinc-cadmium efflux system protein